MDSAKKKSKIEAFEMMSLINISDIRRNEKVRNSLIGKVRVHVQCN